MQLRLRHCLLLFIGLPAMAQSTKTGLVFKSSKAQYITVNKGTIFVNGNRAYQLPPDAVNLASRRNKLIEDNGNVFLFLEINGAPNKNKLYVFGVNNSSVDSLATAISSDVRDYDHDEYLEFGGSDNVPVYPAADSMYYVPSKFYEIKKGRILYDKEYTEKIDMKVNGQYLADPVDANGQYKVIHKPKGHS